MNLDYFYVDNGEIEVEYEVEYRSIFAFMYSECPFSLYTTEPNSGIDGFTIRVTNTDTGQSYEEYRQFFDRHLRMDLSGILRNLAPDVTKALGKTFPYVEFKVEVLYDNSTPVYTFDFGGLYGALNPGESFAFSPYGAANPTPRRLWVNYPQTVRVFEVQGASRCGYTLPSDTSATALNYQTYKSVTEDDIIRSFASSGKPEYDEVLADLRAGVPRVVGVTIRKSIDESGDVVDLPMNQEPLYWLKLIPDLTPFNAPGRVYLRWLQRDGSFGYWLFNAGELQLTAATKQTFNRHYFRRNEATGTTQTFNGYFLRNLAKNPRHSDFSESRILGIGTTVNNEEEFKYLSGLLTSPVVDRMIVYTNSIPAQRVGWERVNIAPSSQSYSKRFDTPHARQIELTLQLPDRDTIKL